MIDRIIEATCEVWNVKKEQVTGRSREYPLPLVRATIAKKLHDNTALPSPLIGEIIGRHRSTAIYYMELYDALIAQDALFACNSKLVDHKIKQKSTAEKLASIFKEALFGKC